MATVKTPITPDRVTIEPIENGFIVSYLKDRVIKKTTANSIKSLVELLQELYAE